MSLVMRIILGLVLSSGIAALAYWKEALSRSGVLGAILLGTAIFGFGGWAWGLTLIAFFLLSSGLSRVQAARKMALAEEKFDKGSTRDFWQAFANAGVGALIAVAYGLGGPFWLAGAFFGTMATANADTWATEIGTLSRNPPRLITTFRQVERGTSGGVTVLGTAATLGGAFIIGLIAFLLIVLEGVFGGAGLDGYGPGGLDLIPAVLLSATGGGLAGSLFDSLLGATVQAMYWSEKRAKETEKVIDPDGTPNTHIRGWRWLNNDAVNTAATAVGALVGALVWMAIR